MVVLNRRKQGKTVYKTAINRKKGSDIQKDKQEMKNFKKCCSCGKKICIFRKISKVYTVYNVNNCLQQINLSGKSTFCSMF